MLEDYKKFNRNILITLIIVVAFLAALNFSIDPYNVFQTPLIKGISVLKPDAKRQERLTKIAAFKLDKRKIDAVFVGTSKVDWALDKKYYKKITGLEAENMAMVGLSFDEFLDLTYACLKIHPEIKNVYFGLDFNTFNKNHKDNQTHIGINQDPNLTTQEVGAALFSLDTTISSFITIIKNINGQQDKMYTNVGTKHIFYNKEIDTYFRQSIVKYFNYYETYKLDEESFVKLKKLNDYCKSKNINLVLFINPSHITDIDEIYESGLWNTFLEWKKDLVQIKPAVDFQYPNKINNVEIKPDMKNFYDAAHATSLIANIMIDKLTGINVDYGQYINSKNIDSYNKINSENLQKWRSANKELVEKVQSMRGQEE